MHPHLPALLALAAGLALAAPAVAQFGVVTNQAGTFTDISATGTVINLTQGTSDDGGGPFTSAVTNALVTTANLWAGTNGLITLNYDPEYDNTAFPLSAHAFALCPIWDDLVIDSPGAKIVRQTVVENGVNVQIIQWHQARTWNAPSGTGNFQVKIFQSGPVYAQFIFQNTGWCGAGSSATVGIQWGASSFAQHAFNSPGALPNNVVLSVIPAATGACCLPSVGGCALTGSGSCTQQGGVYHGDNSTCAQANCPGPTIGPDVIVGEVWDIARNGAVGNITAYSIGTDSCNIGDKGVTWIAETNQHPVISGNIYRLKTVAGAARFEHIGLSWYKHGFLATNDNYCTFAGSCIAIDGAHLGAFGCSDVYTSSLNGSQGNMGARSELNATTGLFPYPSIIQGDGTSAIGKRCQVLTANIDPAQNAGALYFAETHYAVPDDAQWPQGGVAGNPSINGLNNYSHRPMSIGGITATPVFTGPTRMQDPAIQAWKDQDPTVTLVNADYIDTTTGANIVARFKVAAKATSLGGGQWHYEFAVFNLNADRAGGSFSVPIQNGAVITNVGFHAPFYHSGEVFDNTPWNAVVSPTAVTWTPAPTSPAANRNALRWGTTYNFRFDANVAPGVGVATLGLFKAGSPSSLTVPGLPVVGNPCYANCDASTAAPTLNVADFTCFLTRFAAGEPYANCDGSTAAPTLNVADFTCFLQAYANGCP